MSTFCNNFTKYMEISGISRKELAEKLHVTVATIGFYATGRSEPKIDTLIAIADALKVSVDELLGYVPDKLQYWINNFPIPEAEISVSNNAVNIVIENQSSGKWSIIIPPEDFVHFMDEIAKKAHAETDDLYQRALSLATREFIMQIADYEKEK